MKNDKRTESPETEKNLDKVNADISCPLSPGDVVTVDESPLSPPFHALLLGEEEDGVRVMLTGASAGDWRTRVIGRSAGSVGDAPPRLTRYDGELPANEVFLKRFAELVAGDGKFGEALWRMLNGLDVEGEDTDPEIKKFVSDVLYETILGSYCPD